MTILKRLVERGAVTNPITARMSTTADAAVAAFDRVLALESSGPWLTWTYYHRGLARHCRKDLHAAIADYSRAISLSAGNAFALRQRAIAFEQSGDPRRALLDYGRAIKAAPRVAKGYYNRGRVHLELEKRAQAIADFRKALAIGGDAEVESRAREQLAAAQEGTR